MWNIIKRRDFATMFYRQEGNYRIWVIEYEDGYEVFVNDLSVEDVETIFNKSGYATFYEASEAAEFALHEIRCAA